MSIDLHCHSTASDGLLAPEALAARAAANGVSMLALTDHDEIAGLAQARAAAEAHGVRFVDGVEISVTWNSNTIHVVGLNIDPGNAALNAGLKSVREGRARRARRIGEALEDSGVADSFAGAMAYVRNPDLVSRTHFARFLVERGHARDVHGVFQRFLVRGKPGYVPHQWAALGDAVGWIRASGGVAVVAHPGRYKLSKAEMREFLGEFRDCGGGGIEVITGSHAPEQYTEFGRLATQFGLAASRGSDFHGPGESKADLGALPALSDELKPVWREW